MQGLCAVGDGEAISRDLKAFISGAIMQMWQHPSACQSGSSELPQALAIKCPFSSLHFIILLYPTKAMHGSPLPALSFPSCPPCAALDLSAPALQPIYSFHEGSFSIPHPHASLALGRGVAWGRGHLVPIISPLGFASCKAKAQGGWQA